MIYTEDNFLQLSALQHFLYCPRQCALIHIEQVWEENIFTAQGRVMHESAHEERFEMREGVRIERGLPLRSEKLGLNGKADVVEFHKMMNPKGWRPFPVEYKRGKPKLNNCDKVQVCAQAMCIEEMRGVEISYGAIYYGKTRRRLDVEFTEFLRKETKETAQKLHEFIEAGKIPQAEYAKKCESCSLKNICLPKAGKSVKTYLKNNMIS